MREGSKRTLNIGADAGAGAGADAGAEPGCGQANEMGVPKAGFCKQSDNDPSAPADGPLCPTTLSLAVPAVVEGAKLGVVIAGAELGVDAVPLVEGGGLNQELGYGCQDGAPPEAGAVCCPTQHFEPTFTQAAATTHMLTVAESGVGFAPSANGANIGLAALPPDDVCSGHGPRRKIAEHTSERSARAYRGATQLGRGPLTHALPGRPKHTEPLMQPCPPSVTPQDNIITLQSD
jgi:hypothetical protein